MVRKRREKEKRKRKTCVSNMFCCESLWRFTHDVSNQEKDKHRDEPRDESRDCSKVTDDKMKWFFVFFCFAQKKEIESPGISLSN